MPNVSVTPSRPIKNPVRGGRDLNFILRNQGFRTGGVLLSSLLPHLLVTLWHVPDLPPPCPIRWPDFRISSLQQKVPPATRLFQTFHNPCKAFTERCLWTVGSQNRVIFEFSKLRANTTVFEKENISWNVQIRNSLKSIFLLPSKENYQAPEVCMNWREGGVVGVEGSIHLTLEMFFDKSLNTTATNHCQSEVLIKHFSLIRRLIALCTI